MDRGWTKEPVGKCPGKSPFVVSVVVVPCPYAGAGGQATRLCGAHLMIFNYTSKLVPPYGTMKSLATPYLPRNHSTEESVKTNREACSNQRLSANQAQN